VENRTAIRRQIFHDYYLGRWTYNVIKEYRENTKGYQHRDYFMVDKYTKFQSRLYGQAKCRRHRRVTQKNLGSASTCPWYVVMDVDLNREPRTMAKAKCSCNRCHSVGGSSRGKGRCATVNTYVPVIKWECPSNAKYYRYFKGIEEVPVGCTCKRALEV
jgi:hypothetical protein